MSPQLFVEKARRRLFHIGSIGGRVLIGTMVEVFDSDFHEISDADRGKSEPALAGPVVIEGDVFLGSNVGVMKGIAKGAVVANSSVVTKDVLPRVIAGGSPARTTKAIV